MKINNLEIIKPLISNCNEGEFYLLLIIHRPKDGVTKFDKDGNKNHQKTIKSYYVSNAEYLEKKMDEIMALCELFNARAYINLNKKSWKQITGKSIEILGHCVIRDEWKHARSVIDSACGETGACDGKKSYLVDVDTKDESEVEVITKCLYDSRPIGDKIIAKIPTVHGCHLITRGFNPEDFRKFYPKEIDIHKNNPTLLYC